MRPYAGRIARLVTRHGKAAAIAPVFRDVLGLEVLPFDADTDALGTFAGDVPRPAPAPDVVLTKARLAGGLALASEGSFGPDPVIPFLPRGVEHVAFIDPDLGLELVESAVSRDTNYAQTTIEHGQGIERFLEDARFPSHAVLVRAAEWQPGDPYWSGLQDPDAVEAAVAAAAVLSPTRRARLETDMRAHLNPTRMAEIARVAERLAARLATPCPACGAPGFGCVDVVRGLACEACGTDTGWVRAEVFGCTVCGCRETRPRADGLQWADPAHCPECNP